MHDRFKEWSNARSTERPFSQVAFERAKIPGGSEVDRAVKFFVRNRMSRQGMGTSFATMVRSRRRRKVSDPLSAYLSAVEALPEIHDRLTQGGDLQRRRQKTD